MLNTSRLSILLLIIALASLFPSRPANAIAYVMPVSMTSGAWPRVAMDILSWSEASGVTNPCYGSTECWVGPDVLYASGAPSLSGSCLDYGNCIRINQYRTAEEVAAAFRSAKEFLIVHRLSLIAQMQLVLDYSMLTINQPQALGMQSSGQVASVVKSHLQIKHVVFLCLLLLITGLSVTQV